MIQQWERNLFSGHWWKHPAEIIALAVFAWFLHRYVIAWLRKLTKRTETTFDDIVVDLLARALRPLLVIAVVAGGVKGVALRAELVRGGNRIRDLGALALGGD